MSQREFAKLLNTLGELSPEQMVALRRELDSKLSPPRPGARQGITTPFPKAEKPAKLAATVFDMLEPTGLIGCIKGKPGSPTDLATNPAHMERFGRA